jgi:chemotaxis protein MotA
MGSVVRFDLSSLLGLVVSLAAIAVGMRIEGGRVSSILQPTAALIVLGGTAGALAAQYPLSSLRRMFVDLARTLRRPPPAQQLVQKLVDLSRRARRDGMLALENELGDISEPFLRRGIELAVDVSDPLRVRALLEGELDRLDEERERSARVLESAGGYSPTIGILGAVLGLIHVMERLSEPSQLGGGIAVAFVSTVYGVGFANLVYLPLAGRLRERARADTRRLEVALEGAVAIAEQQTPRNLLRRLSAMVESAADNKPAANDDQRSAA